MVKPISLYGCEVWGYGNNKILERVHLKFCKLLLKSESRHLQSMIYSEFGRYPIEIDIRLE
jgi:hypothetical protein